MLRVGDGKLRRQRIDDRITMVQGDAARIPLGDASVDAATIGFGIRNVEDMHAACAELHRVLKPGGRLAILEFAVPDAPVFSGFYRWYTNRVLPRIGRALSRNDSAYAYLPASISAFASPDEFVKILRQAGFVTIPPIRLMLGSVILYTARRD
jgi:demethylmenaquinone methyltransferase/2-methoxy-6-polyprenyl-1,4-benzoquinol methylase